MKKIFLGIYLSYTTGYIWIFFLKNKIFHFEQWFHIIFILFLFQFSVLKPWKKDRIKNEILLFIYFTLFSFGFKIYLIGSKNIKELLLKIVNLEKELLSLNWIFIILSISYIVIKIITERNVENKSKIEIYPEREKDKDYIYENFLNNKYEVNILGINGEFGEGKSFLIDKIIDKLEKDKFEVIKIKCLLLEKEEVYIHIAKLLNKILIKNCIFDGHLEKLEKSLLNILDNFNLKGITDIFIKETGIDDIVNFKKALFRLNKTIVLIFDDLDRSNNKEKIEKILSFIDDFSENNIKSIVLFNSENLKKIDKRYDRNYLEKYIPFIMNLTKVPFETLLLKEIKNKNLEEKEFDFLVSFFIGKEKVYYKNNKLKRMDKEIKFREDFENLIFLKVKSKINITPRKIKNFIEEINILFLNKSIKIEKRIILAFIFLKNIFYEEFFEKLEEEISLKKLFPINIKLLDIGVELSLDEIDTLKKLTELNKKNEIFHGEEKINYIDIGDHRIFLMEKKYEGIFEHLNIYLKKLKIEELKEFSEKEIYEKIEEISKILRENKKEIIEGKENILIYDLFNYSLFYNADKDKAEENNEKIENAIKKLKFIGIEDYFSTAGKYYEELKKILEKKELEEQLKEYYELLENCYYGKIKSPFFMGETYEERTMKILNIFEDEKNKKKYKEMIFFKNKNKLTDEYLLTFLTGKNKKYFSLEENEILKKI